MSQSETTFASSGSTGSCHSCGAAVNTAFCGNCGAPQRGRQCYSCQATLSSQSKFCHRCGVSQSQAERAPNRVGSRPAVTSGERTPWVVASVIIIAAVGLIVWRVTGPQAPAPAGGGVGVSGAAPAPDISQMSPVEQFMRLNDRIMTAARNGDSAQVAMFLPMAFGAYRQLPATDTDLRYHAALLHAQAGNWANASALADSILAQESDNLLGLALQGTLAELTGDRALKSRAYERFTAVWSSEIVRDNQEYIDHRDVLDAFRGAGGN